MTKSSPGSKRGGPLAGRLQIGWARVAGLGVLLVLLALRVSDPVPVQNLRNAAFDQFQRWNPREYTPVPVTIVDLDDRSIAEIGQWPWPRTRVAELVRKIAEAGAVAMAFDVVFSEPDRLSPAIVAGDNPGLPGDVRAGLHALPSNDAVLAAAFAQVRVVAGQASIRRAADSAEAPVPLRPVPHAFLGPDPTPFLQRFPDALQNLPVLEEAASGHGVFSVRPDADGIYRRVPLVMMVQEQIRLGLSAELLRVATGGGAFAVRSNEAGVDAVIVARQPIGTYRDGSVWPYFGPSDASRYVRSADVLMDRVPQGRLAGQLVLIGTSAIGLEDFRPTPLGTAMAGVEIHAQVLENILGGSFLQRPNYTIAVELLIAGLLGILVVLLVPALGGRWVILLASAMLAGYAAASYKLFLDNRVLLDPTFPVLATGLVVMLMATANYLREERAKRQIRGAFGQYVSPALVDTLIDDPERLTLGGETRELTLLFSDVRGFTTIAEEFREDPEGLTALMNAFLTRLSQAILDQGGTVDKFMGDAVMAFWNAPLPTEYHAEAAARAALDMLERVEILNRTRQEEAAREGRSVHRINVGIGINTGTCVVGNMGSDTRFDYTALGDPVNLASRLEGQSKTYGFPIILGATTAAQLGKAFATLEVDLIRVKGKRQPEHIYALLADLGRRDLPGWAEIVDLNGQLLMAYRSQDWVAAEAAIDGLAQLSTRSGLPMAPYLDLYRDRIAMLRADPPGPDWDGVFVATSK